MTEGLQPFLSDAVVSLCAPTQVWSGRDGDVGGQQIDGVYHGDLRHVRELSLTWDGRQPEWISISADGPSRVVFGGLLRALEDQAARERTVAAALELYHGRYSRTQYEGKIRQLLERLR